MGDPERLMKLYEEHNPSGGKKDAIQRIVKGGFSYTDFRSQLKTMSSIGGIGSMMSMLPGLGGMQMPQGADEMSRTQLAKFSAIIDSMTPAGTLAQSVGLCQPVSSNMTPNLTHQLLQNETVE